MIVKNEYYTGGHRNTHLIIVENGQKYKMYGIAFDLGTTTLEGYFCDIESGEIIKTEKCLNPQQKYGLDVLSRVSYSQGSEENARNLAKILEDAIRRMVTGFLGGLEHKKQLLRIVFVGNPVILGSIRKVNFSDLAQEIIIPPAIGGFVGADALMASYMCERKRGHENVLMIDVGTNTEIVLLTDEGAYATSAASGPAFEGGNISCGMVGGPGAIDKCVLTDGVSVKSDIIYHVMEKDGESVAPSGICGSGLLDILGILLESGAIDNTGYYSESLVNKGKSIPGRIYGRIKQGSSSAEEETGKNPEDNQRYFELTKGISITQQDIRNLQLAISAIRSGVEMLFMKAGLTDTVIECVYMAGNFGSHLSEESLLRCGMLPPGLRGKVVQSGNLAGVGACELILEEATISDVIEYKKSILTVSLADEEQFKYLFFKYMNFPQSILEDMP